MEDRFRHQLAELSASWVEITPGMEVRNIAAHVLLNHPLRAGDAFQLASALVWTRSAPRGHKIVCLDHRLRDAARKQGFALLPERLP